ncbi:MAG: bacteriohemerythrin [Terracidiphilus sp.]|jgi:hemerythrin
MPFTVWNDRISVGVETIDADHKKLVGMINDLYDAIVAGCARKKLDGLLDHLVDYTRYHFAREEELLVRTGYPDAAAHKRAHDEMAAWMNTASHRYHNSSAIAPSLEVMNYLTDWLYNHILGLDQKFAPHLKAHNIL